MLRGLICIIVLFYAMFVTVMALDVVLQKEIASHKESKPQISEGTSFTASIKPVGSAESPNNSSNVSVGATSTAAIDHEEKLEKLVGKVETLEGKIEKLVSEQDKFSNNDNKTDLNAGVPNIDGKNAKNNNAKIHTANDAQKADNGDFDSKVNQIYGENKDDINYIGGSSQKVTLHEFKQHDIGHAETRNETNRSNVAQKIQNGRLPPILPNPNPRNNVATTSELQENNWNFLNWIGNLVTKEFGFFVKMSAIISNVIMSLTPFPSIIKILNEKSTGNLSSLPYLMSLISASLYSLYGYLSKKPLILMSNLFGFLMGVIYVSIFHRNCHEKSKMMKLLKYYKISCGILIFIFTSYIAFDMDIFIIIIGVFAAVVSFLSYAAPLESIPMIFKERDTSCIPIEIILGNFWSCIFMLSYGFTIWDHFVIVPNFLGILVGSAQVGVLLIYPRKERGFTYIDDGIHTPSVIGTKLV